jgi:penicillin-binding protein 1A
MEQNRFLDTAAADSLRSLPLELRYRPFRHDQGLAPYFREAVRKEVADWLERLPESDSSLNLYTSGLKIYTTLNAKMQELAEKSMKEHMSELQDVFEKAYGAAAPWLSKEFRDGYIRQSGPYRKLEEAGWPHDRIMDSLEATRTMVLEDWKGERTVESSAADSLLHYARQLNTGSLSIEARSGAVLTWIGGIDYQHYKFDHISQSRRQVGSTFKPILYTAAMESGIAPCDYFSARKVRYANLEDWTPSNSGSGDEAYLNYSMQEALTHSVNTVAVKILERTGIRATIEQSRAFGITAELPEKPSLALGVGSIGIPELAGAYASFINDSRPQKPYLIQSIRDAQGRERYQHKAEPERPAYSKQTQQLMLEMLQSVVERGTASRLRGQYKLSGELAGKTGTTQNNKDAWFVGITPHMVHVSWVGLESYELGFPNTRIGQGANAALPLFALWYQKLGRDPLLRIWTQGQFENPDPSAAAMLECAPVKKDGFFKRLFTNPKKAKTRKFRGKSNP